MAGKPLKMKLAVEFPLRRGNRENNPALSRTLVLLSKSEKSRGCGVPGCLLTQALCDGVSRGLSGAFLEDPGASDNVGVKRVLGAREKPP